MVEVVAKNYSVTLQMQCFLPLLLHVKETNSLGKGEVKVRNWAL